MTTMFSSSLNDHSRLYHFLVSSQAIARHRQELVDGNDDIHENRSAVAARIMLRGGHSDDHDNTTDRYNTVATTIMEHGRRTFVEHGDTEAVSVTSRSTKRTPSTIVPPFGKVAHSLRVSGRVPPKPTWKAFTVHVTPTTSSLNTQQNRLTETEVEAETETETDTERPSPPRARVQRPVPLIQRPSWPLAKPQPATNTTSSSGINNNNTSTKSRSGDSQSSKTKPLLPQVQALLTEPPQFADELRAMAGIAVSSCAQRRLHPPSSQAARSTTKLTSQSYDYNQWIVDPTHAPSPAPTPGLTEVDVLPPPPQRRKSSMDALDKQRRPDWKEKVTYLPEEDAFLIRL